MTIRIERRYGKIGVDLRLRLPDGRRVRERCIAPIQDEAAALKWARKREQFLLDGHNPYRRSTSLDQPGEIYFVQAASGAIKIGWSCALRSRMAALATDHHETLALLGSVPGTLRDEKVLHKRFAQLRIRGEWFRADATLLTHIVEIGRGRGRDCITAYP